MKTKLAILTALSFFIISCNNETLNDSTLTKSQLIEKLGFAKSTPCLKTHLLNSFYWENHFCSYNLNLYQDSTFEVRQGCESHVQLTIGKWIVRTDSLILTDKSVDKLNLICNSQIKAGKENYFVLSVSNRFDKPLEGFAIIAYDNSVKHPEKYGIRMTNKFGVIKIEKSKCDSISIISFRNITNKILTIKKKDFPDTLSMRILISGELTGKLLEYSYSKKETIFKIRKNELIRNNIILSKRIKQK